MYYTKLVLPALKTYQLDRTIPGSANAFVAQQADAFQECVYTVLCANLEEVDALVKEIQASEWQYEVNPQFAPIQEGIGRFSGTISCRRLLPMNSSGEGLQGDAVGDAGGSSASYTVVLQG